MKDFEKLGSFYLGKITSDSQETTPDELLLYDAKDLTTHAMCVGMTGSGKTGLCVGLLEEAAIDGIPAIVIDPKGDLGNLLLTFPELKDSDFRPWVDERQALRKGLSVDEYASATAQTWREGLAQWGQGPARIKRLREATDLSIYTPGSSAGLPLTILRSFAAPPEDMRADSDMMRDRVMAAVSGLLALLGIEADPIQSQEHILLSNILDLAWREGQNLEIADIIRGILDPPFKKLGVFDLESFYPEKDRRALAMQLNNVLASPSFSAWLQGDPLDIGSLLYSSKGKPRISILSIAHLSDAERMFFVTLLLNEVVAWMRQQKGTSSLRAILYMDEIFGYFPPSANPPSKQPMLTLLKQARAFGLGCVLATQNPVDLDYKGLSNTGTWFIGRLQTERDKMRVLDGLEGATSSAGKVFDRKRMETTISGLGKRVFLMNNVHDDQPVLFQTRWAMSYLRGPLTRTQIETLMASRKKQAAAQTTQALASTAVPAEKSEKIEPAEVSSLQAFKKPILPTGVKQTFFSMTGDVPEGSRVVYRPRLHAAVRMHYVSAKYKRDEWIPLQVLTPMPEDQADISWDQATVYEDATPQQLKKGLAEATYAELSAAAVNARNYSKWKKSLIAYLYQDRRMTVWVCPQLRTFSEVGESEKDFRVRLTQTLHEDRDLALEKLRQKYTPKLARIEERIRKAQQRVDVQKSQYKQKGLTTAITIGSTLLGALLGRRSGGRVSTSMSRVGQTARERGDIKRAQEDVKAAQEQLIEMEKEFQDEAAQLKRRDASDLSIQEVPIRPRKADITVSATAVAWTPWCVDGAGIAEPAF